MELFRVVSDGEYDEFVQDRRFRLGVNTLEAKQFFKSKIGVNEFLSDSRSRGFEPPYTYLLIVDIEETCLENIPYDEQELDRHMAITIQEDDLENFNNCINFVNDEYFGESI